MSNSLARNVVRDLLARPTWDINHVIAFGQSLAQGYEGWPALSRAQALDNLMLGESVRGGPEESPDWVPLGEAAFRPLVATVQTPGGGPLLPAEAVAALTPGDLAAGETVVEGALNAWRGRLLAEGAERGKHRLLGSAAGVGGRTIEALSRGAQPELFNRLRSCVAAAKRAADAAGLSYGVTAVLFLQGEANALGADGGTSERGAYHELLSALLKDMRAEIAAASGQRPPFGLFCYQTGGQYANETNSIAQAQLDFVLQTTGCTMVAPTYPVTEKGGHLDANGYRWLGMQFGKVLHRVLTQGQEFRPLHPTRASVTGRRLRVAFHIPVPPLAWDMPFKAQTRIEVPARGFAPRDEAGEIAVEQAAIVDGIEVELLLGRDPVGPVVLHYADASRDGRGMLRDSDAEIAPESYIYDPAAGHYPTANQPELNGRPYPLHNWCVAFRIKVQTLAAPSTGPALPNAWEVLHVTRAQVTGAPLPAQGSWLRRLWRGLFG